MSIHAHSHGEGSSRRNGLPASKQPLNVYTGYDSQAAGDIRCPTEWRLHHTNPTTHDCGRVVLHATTRGMYTVQSRGSNQLYFMWEISAANGSYPGLPKTRAHTFVVRGFPASSNITMVTINGVAVPRSPSPTQSCGWWIVPEGAYSLVWPVGSLVVQSSPLSLTTKVNAGVEISLI